MPFRTSSRRSPCTKVRLMPCSDRGSADSFMTQTFNRFDAGAEGIEDEHIHKALNRNPDWRIPNDYAAVRRMQTAATPLTEGDTEIACAIRNMAKSVCGQEVEQVGAKKKSRSFFSFSF